MNKTSLTIACIFIFFLVGCQQKVQIKYQCENGEIVDDVILCSQKSCPENVCPSCPVCEKTVCPECPASIEDNSPIEIQTESCEEKAKELIPDKIYVYRDDDINRNCAPDCVMTSPFDDNLKEKNKFKDGTYLWTKLNDGRLHPALVMFRKGYQTGENLNHYYQFFENDNDYIFYQNEVTDNEGNILGYNLFRLEIKGKLTDETIDREIVGKANAMEVIDFEISQCSWIDES